MIEYQIEAWKEEEEIDLGSFDLLSEALEAGREYCPAGFTVTMIEADEEGNVIYEKEL